MSATSLALQPGDGIAGTKYRVVRPIGAGGMGIVYQVVKPPNIQGVLKLMSSELAGHDEHRTRFFDEVRILAQLDHPNIVKVFDYDTLADGTLFYVMELLSGRTVRDVLNTIGRVPPRVAYEITRQLLEALQCAHTHEVPVIHRDIKPENIFLHSPRHGEPVVKLIDFGVSAVADRKHDGAFVGTWSYAAPEQIRGERPTPATDLYATGLVLYEMLAGVGPFDHLTEWALISAAQLKDVPPPVSRFAPWVPASIVKLIASALEKDPGRRPADAYTFSERLFELEWASDGKDPHDLTVSGPPAGAGARAARDAERTRTRPPTAPGSEPVIVNGTGPLSRMLSSVTGGAPSSKAMAAASPASDRLGDVPLIGVPPESVRVGPTWKGLGEARHEPTAPDADALLAGLGAAPRRPPSKRERESDPEVSPASRPSRDLASTPRPGQVVIRAGREPSEPHAPTTPRANAVRYGRGDGAAGAGGGGTAVMGDAAGGRAVAVAAASEPATRPPPRGRAALLAVAGVLLTTFAIAAVVVSGARRAAPAPGGASAAPTASAAGGASAGGALTTGGAPTTAGAPTIAAEPAAGASAGGGPAAAATAASAAPPATVTPPASRAPAPTRGTSAGGRPGGRGAPSASSGRGDYMNLRE